MKSQAKPSAHSWLAHPAPAATEPTDQIELLARHLWESSTRATKVKSRNFGRRVTAHAMFASPAYKGIADYWRTIAADALIFLQKP